MSIGTFIGEKYTDIDREVTYSGRLTSEELQEFDEMQDKARQHFQENV